MGDTGCSRACGHAIRSTPSPIPTHPRRYGIQSCYVRADTERITSSVFRRAAPSYNHEWKSRECWFVLPSFPPLWLLIYTVSWTYCSQDRSVAEATGVATQHELSPCDKAQ